jgi:hypothetical protein
MQLLRSFSGEGEFKKKETGRTRFPLAVYPPPGTTPNLLLHAGERMACRQRVDRDTAGAARIEAYDSIF